MKVLLVADVTWQDTGYGDAHCRFTDLPMAPFPGLILYRLVGTPFMDEWIVDQVEIDLESNVVKAYLSLYEEGVYSWSKAELCQLADIIDTWPLDDREAIAESVGSKHHEGNGQQV